MKFPTQKLNEYFKNAKPLKGILSIWGDFGVGKTTFAIQTALNSARIGNQVIFIYTKPNPPLEKFGLIQKESSNILENILFIHSTNFEDIYNCVFNFEFLILKFIKENNQNFKLIVIDSLTNLYRIELNKDRKEKNYDLNYKLNQILANLWYINEVYNIEILIVNEISRKNINDQIYEVQSGGKVMNYWVKQNIKISRTGKLNEREFNLTKESKHKPLKFRLFIKENGFE